MASASQAFAEPIHRGPSFMLAGFPCYINPYEVKLWNRIAKLI